MGIAALCFLAALVTPAAAALEDEYHVCPKGDDADPGTAERPFRTLNRGVRPLKPGDRLVVREGVYRESLRSNIPPGAGWDAPVTIQARPGDKVVVRPDEGSGPVMEFGALENRPQQYIVVDGLVLDGINVKGDGVKIYAPAHHLRFVRGEIKNAGNQGILGRADGCEFLDLLVHDNGIVEGAHGLYLHGTGARIEGCRIYNNFGNGLRNSGLKDTVIAYNVIHHNGRGQASPAVEFHGDDNVMHHNLIYRNRCNWTVSARVTGKIYHNTIVGNVGYGIYMGAKKGVMHIANNIVVDNTYPGIFNGESDPASVVENNIVYGHRKNLDNWAKGGTWRNNTEADPRFVDKKGRDYRLDPDSPARDAGAGLEGLSRDLDGAPSPAGAAPDVGAYEWVASLKRALGNCPPEVDAGKDLMTTLSTSKVALAGTAVDDGHPGSRMAFAWKMMYGPGKVTFDAPDSLRTSASFSAPGAYLLKLFADDGQLTAGDLVVVHVYPKFEPGAPVRVEAEYMLLDHYQVKPAPFASGEKYVWKYTPMNCDIRALLPLEKGAYDVFAGYFDGKSGRAQLELSLFRGDPNEPGNYRVLGSKRWDCDADLDGRAPSEETAVRKPILADVELEPGDRIVIRARKGGEEEGTVDYVEFVRKVGKR